MNEPKQKKKKYIIVSIVTLLIIGRILLPSIILHYLNDYLENDVDAYVGHINDFDLSLWRGAYQIEEFSLKRKTSKNPVPFMDIKKADISISWKALFRGKFLVDLVVDGAKINFTDSSKKDQKQLGVEAKNETWGDLLDSIVPFNLESLKITKGEVHFINNELKTPIDIHLTKAELMAHNIHNSKKHKGSAFSDYDFSAVIQEDADIKSKGTFNILAKPITFDTDLSITKLNLTKLNEFAKVYGPLDLTSGEFNFFMEIATHKGKLRGYVKPLFTNMDVRAGAKEKDDSLKELVYELLTAVTNIILKNSKSKSFATKVPIKGTTDKPEFEVGKGIWEAIDNGFGEPTVKPKFDHDISLKSVQ